MACGDREDEVANNMGNNGDKGDKEKPVAFVAHITPIEQLNQGEPVINSHADVTSRSSLMMNYRKLVTMEASYPRYPRIKRMKNGDYICSIIMAVQIIILDGVAFMLLVRI